MSWNNQRRLGLLAIGLGVLALAAQAYWLYACGGSIVLFIAVIAEAQREHYGLSLRSAIKEHYWQALKLMSVELADAFELLAVVRWPLAVMVIIMAVLFMHMIAWPWLVWTLLPAPEVRRR